MGPFGSCSADIASARLEEKRNAVRLALVRMVLDGDWHCSSTKNKGNHRPDRLVEFMSRAGNFDQATISTMLDALTRTHADAPYSDPWGDTESQAGIFEDISNLSRQQHANDGGLCLLCVEDVVSSFPARLRPVYPTSYNICRYSCLSIQRQLSIL